MMKPTDENLESPAATEPLTRWLISAAKEETTLTYGRAKGRLETECGFSTILFEKMGRVAGAMQDKIHELDSSAPLLNVLLVRKDTGLPGEGLCGYLAERFPEESWLEGENAHKDDRWEDVVGQATDEVYAYGGWDVLYERLYGKKLESDPFYAEEVERDGLPRVPTGEGKNHKALREWVKDNPGRVERRLRDVKADTEVELLSGDRVDVVYYAKREIVAIEVKSRDSNWADLRRGIYQCVKYEAVLRAQERKSRSVRSLLVTESELYDDLEQLAKKLRIQRRVVQPT